MPGMGAASRLGPALCSRAASRATARLVRPGLPEWWPWVAAGRGHTQVPTTGSRAVQPAVAQALQVPGRPGRGRPGVLPGTWCLPAAGHAALPLPGPAERACSAGGGRTGWGGLPQPGTYVPPRSTRSSIPLSGDTPAWPARPTPMGVPMGGGCRAGQPEAWPLRGMRARPQAGVRPRTPAAYVGRHLRRPGRPATAGAVPAMPWPAHTTTTAAHTRTPRTRQAVAGTARAGR